MSNDMTKPMNLYQIHNEYVAILEDLYDDNGEINEEALARLRANEMTLENKAISTISFVQSLEAMCKVSKEKRDEMAAREKLFKKKNRRFERTLARRIHRARH